MDIKLGVIDQRVCSVQEAQRLNFLHLQELAQRHHDEDRAYFEAQQTSLDFQFELLKKVDKKIDGLSDALTKGLMQCEATFERISAKISSEIVASSASARSDLERELAHFHEELKKHQAHHDVDSLDLKQLIEESLVTVGADIKVQLEASMAQVLATAHDSAAAAAGGDPSKDDKLDALIAMVESTRQQIGDVKEGLGDLRALSTEQYLAGERYIMPASLSLARSLTHPALSLARSLPLGTSCRRPSSSCPCARKAPTRSPRHPRRRAARRRPRAGCTGCSSGASRWWRRCAAACSACAGTSCWCSSSARSPCSPCPRSRAGR